MKRNVKETDIVHSPNAEEISTYGQDWATLPNGIYWMENLNVFRNMPKMQGQHTGLLMIGNTDYYQSAYLIDFTDQKSWVYDWGWIELP